VSAERPLHGDLAVGEEPPVAPGITPDIERARRRANDELLKYRLVDFLYVPLALVVSFAAAYGIFQLPHPMGLAAGLVILPVSLMALKVLKDPAWGVYLLYFIDIFRPQDQWRVLGSFKPSFLMLGFVGIVYLLKIVQARGRGLVWNRQTTAYALLFAVMTLTVFTAVNNFFAYNSWRGMLTIFMTYFFATNLINSRRKLSVLVRAVIVFYLLLTLKGLKAYATGGSAGLATTASAYLADENDFALALLVVMPFAIYGLVLWRGKLRKLAAGIMLFLFLLGVVLSMSRGGFVGLVASLGFCWWRGKKRIPLAIGTVVIVGLLAAVAPAQFWKEMRTIDDTSEGTADIRIKSWKAGWYAYLDYPILGMGAGNSGIAMAEYYPGGDANTKWGRQMHGTLPQLVAEVGTIGAFFFLLLVFFMWRDMRRTERAQGLSPREAAERDFLVLSLRGSLVGYFVAGAFLSTLYYPHLYMLAALATLVTVHYGRGGAERAPGAGAPA
jgi:probable O-glycosylation ligase (exosortase A-associated)